MVNNTERQLDKAIYLFIPSFIPVVHQKAKREHKNKQTKTRVGWKLHKWGYIYVAAEVCMYRKVKSRN